MLATLHRHRVVSIRRQRLIEGRDEKRVSGAVAVLNCKNFVLRERQFQDEALLAHPETRVSLAFVVEDHEIAGVWTLWGRQREGFGVPSVHRERPCHIHYCLSFD